MLICDCGKKATWMYMPGDSVACDDCVPRGCSCNKELKDGIEPIFEGNVLVNPEDDFFVPTDDQGREYPCCEWMQTTEDDHTESVCE